MKTAENKKNYEKLQELYRRSIPIIRKYFHSLPAFPEDPKDLYNALKKLEKRIKRLGFNDKQLDLLFPNSKETDSEKFDPSIFRKLIAHFGVVRGPKFWTSNQLPPSNDTSDEANILRLFIERNNIMHLVGYISTDEYNVRSQNIIDALVSLGEDRATFYNLLPPKQYCLTKPVTNFCGRNSELKHIHDIVESGKNSMLRIVVHGMSGLGKSEIVRKYCDKYGKTFDDNILWIDSTNKPMLETSFRSIAETLLKLEIKDQNGHYKGNHFIVDSVHQYFRSEKVLFVFDDVTDINMLKPFLPSYSDSCSIITSQLADWPISFQPCKIKKLGIIDSELFLNNNLGDHVQLNAEQTTKVCEILQGHFLALQQFLASIKNTVLEVDEYIELLDSKTAKMLNTTFQGDKSTIAAIQINMERLNSTQGSNLAYEILNHLAYFNGEEINFDILKVLFPEYDRADLETALQKLSSYSLINKRNRNIITVHSLVQETLKYEHDDMSDRETYLKNCLRMFQNQLNVEKEILQHSQFAEKWYQQFIYFISLNIDNQNIHDFMITKAGYIFYMLSTKGKYEDLIRFFERIHKNSLSKHEENHKETFKELFWMARCYHDTWQFDRSVELLHEVITQRKSLFGENDPVILISMSSLGCCCQGKGMLKKAIELYKKTLQKQKSLFGENDRYTLTSMNNLAACYQQKGMLEEAIELHKQTLEKGKSLFGENDRTTLTSMNNLAYCYQQKGMLDEAIELHKKTLEKRKSLFGDNDRYTLTSMNNLAECYQQKGMLEEAIELHKETLGKKKSLFGGNDRNTLSSMNNLAECFRQKGMLEEAIELHKKTLGKNKALFDENDRDTLRSMCNLAGCYHQKGMLEEAIELHKKTLGKKKSLFGENNRDTLGSMNNLAECYHQKGMLEEAIELHKKTFGKNKSLFGENDGETLTSMNNLANCYLQKRMLEEAIVLLQKAYTICKEYFDENDPLLKAISRNLNLALVNQFLCYIRGDNHN